MSETLWAVVLGALLGLPALALQLVFAARDRERDRRLSLRNDVHLEAIESVAAQHQYFLRFANLETPLSQFDRDSPTTGWLNKIHAVATLDTIEAFTEADSSIGSAAFNLLRHRLAVEKLISDLEGCRNTLAQLRSFHGWLVESSKHPPGFVTPEAEERLNWTRTAIQQVEADISSLGQTENDLSARKASAHEALLLECIQRWVDHRSVFRRCVVALRNEIEFPLEAGIYEEKMKRADDEMMCKLKQLLDDLRRDAE